MRASQLLVPVGLIGALLVAGVAAGRSAARSDVPSDPKTTTFQWDELGKALDDAAVGRPAYQRESPRPDTLFGGSQTLDELSRFAHQLERAARRVDIHDVEDYLDDLGVDVDELDIDLDDLEDTLENLEEALEELADFTRELEGQLELRVRDGRIVVVERRGGRR
jgi:hypothetical protein